MPAVGQADMDPGDLQLMQGLLRPSRTVHLGRAQIVRDNAHLLPAQVPQTGTQCFKQRLFRRKSGRQTVGRLSTGPPFVRGKKPC